MLLRKSLAFASALAAFPGALAVALQDTSGQPYGGHVDYVFDIANADVQPVSFSPLSFVNPHSTSF